MYINFPDVLVPAEASVQTGYSKKKKRKSLHKRWIHATNLPASGELQRSTTRLNEQQSDINSSLAYPLRLLLQLVTAKRAHVSDS